MLGERQWAGSRQVSSNPAKLIVASVVSGKCHVDSWTSFRREQGPFEWIDQEGIEE